MDNKLELLVGIVADTEGSKSALQTQISDLSKNLKGLDNIKLGISKDDVKALQDIAKIDFSKLRSVGDGVGEGLSKASKQVKDFATVTKDQLSEAMNLSGLNFDNRQALSSIDDIEKRIKSLDSKGTLEIIKIPDKAGNEVDTLIAKYQHLGNQITTTFDTVKRTDSNALEFMPRRISEIDLNLKQVTQSTEKFASELDKAERAGKVTAEQASNLRKEMESLQSKEGFSNISGKQTEDELRNRKEILDSVSQLQSKLVQTQYANKKSAEAEVLKVKQLKEQEAVQERIRKTIVEITRMQGKNPQAFNNNPEVDGMLASLKQIDPASKGAASSVKSISDNFDMMKAKATEAGRESMTFMNSFKTAMEKFPVNIHAGAKLFELLETP